MRAVVGASLVASLLLAFSTSPGAAPQARGQAPAAPAAATPAPAAAKPGAAKAEPGAWPDAKVLADRQKDSENRLLFQGDEPVAVTLTADFKAVTRDRNPESIKTFPATLTFADATGATVSKTLAIRNRGHSRRQVTVCDFPPIRMEFEKDSVTGTVFAGHRELKLGTHCRENAEFEQYVLREHAAYRILNLITPQSFRTRLARVTYIDAATQKPLTTTRHGLFIEDEDDVARRLGGRIVETKNMLYRHFTPESTTWLGLFEYMIGNTDVSVVSQHNVRTIETPASGRYVVPYDFDYSGLVNASYAIANAAFRLVSVKDRLYRGPCRTPEEFEPYLAKLRTIKPDVLAIYDTLPGLSDNYRKSAKNYLEEFYKTIDKPDAVKKQLISGCIKSGI